MLNPHLRSYNVNATVSASKSVACPARALGYTTLPDLAPTACDDPTVSYSFTHVEGGVDLEINYAYEAGRNLTGTHFIPDSEIVLTNTESPTGTVETYAGPADFVITDLQPVAAA